MNYSPEDLQLFQKYGVSPDTHELDRNTWEFVPKGGNKIQPEGAVATAVRRGAGEALPFAASVPGFVGGMKFGSKIPGPAPVKALGGLAAGLVGGGTLGTLAHKAQNWAAEELDPDLTAGWNLQEQANAEENPKSDIVGGLLPMAGANKINGLPTLVRGLRSIIARGTDKVGLEALAQTGLNATMGAGQEIAHEFDTKKPMFGLSPSRIATAGIGSAVFGDFRKPIAKGLSKLGLNVHSAEPELLDQAAAAIKSPTKIKTTPEGAATLEQQFRDVVDPASSRAAVFVPEGTTVNTKLPAGLVEVKRPDGVAFVNPQKGADVELIRTAPEMPGDALGMSQTVKPADGTDVVVGEKGGNEVSAEVVNGNDPAAVKAATEAASNASPGADVKVTSPQEVLENRLKSWRERERAITEVPLADQAAIQRAKEKQHADHMAKLNAEFEASLGRTEQEVKAAQNKNAQNAEQARLNDEAAFWKHQHAQTEQLLAEWRQAAEEARVKLEAERKRRADDFEKARIEKDTQDREAAEQDAWNKKKTFIWGKGQTGRLAGLENRPTGDFVKPEDPSLSAPLNEAEQIQERFDRNKYQTDEDAINAQIEAYEKSLLEEEAAAAGVKPEGKGEKTPKAKAPPVIKPLEGKISQAWYDLWKRAGFDKYGATTDQRAGMLTDEGKPARGSYNPETRQVEVDPARADFDNQPHELFHAWLIDVAEHGNSAEKAFAKKMLERFGAEEPGVQATGEHAVSRAKGDDSFLKDALAFVKYKVGRANERDFARLASNEMYRGRGFKGEVEGLKPTVGGVRNQPDDTKFQPDEPRKFEKQPAAILSSHVNKLRKANDPKLKAAGDALLEAYHDRTELTGRWSETAKDALHTDNATANAARDWLIHAEATETEGYPEGASDKLKAAIDSFRAMYRQVREDQNARKLPVRDRDNNMREGRMDPTGMPHLLDADAGYLLKHGQGTEEWHQMAEEFKDFNRPRMQERHQIGKKNPLSDEAIEAILDAKIRKLSGAEPMRGTSSEWRAHARALRLAEDTKLPPSMIEKDFKKLITKYIGAAAKDLALHSNVEAHPELNDTFGLNDQVKPEDTRAGNSELSKALDEYMGNVQEESKLGQIGNAGSVLATTGWTSNPVSRGKDFLGTYFRGLAHAKNPLQWPSITASAIKGLVSKDVKTAARVGGLVQPRHNFMDNMIGNTERVKNWVRKSANAYSTATGSEALENHSRYMAQGMGRTLVDIHGDAALRGDKSSQIFMEELAPVKWQEMLGTENGRNLLASRVGEAFQAAYNGSNLPDWALKGQFAPYARLMKWSIEQANNFRRFQLRPLIENKDPRPLAMYVTTMLGGGFAVKKLAETIANRQSYTPTWLEIENAKDKDKAKQAAAAKVMNAVEMVGMFGVFSSLGNMVTQAMTGQATQTPSNPFLSATGDSLNYAVAAGRAILDGQDPMKVLPKAMDDIANSQISMYRVGKNWLADDKEKMQRQGRRDYAVYQTLAGEKVEPYNKRYSYESADENEFDRAELKDSPRIIREIIANTPRAKLPEKMQKLGSIGGANIGPSSKDTNKLMAYIDYIRRTQGEAKARQLARTIMRDDVEKDIKRSMVPR